MTRLGSNPDLSTRSPAPTSRPVRFPDVLTRVILSRVFFSLDLTTGDFPGFGILLLSMSHFCFVFFLALKCVRKKGK